MTRIAGKHEKLLSTIINMFPYESNARGQSLLTLPGPEATLRDDAITNCTLFYLTDLATLEKKREKVAR